MKWLDLAEAEIGIKEVPGTGDNPRVLEYHSATSYGAPHDSVPWCSSFINWPCGRSRWPCAPLSPSPLGC